MQIHIIHLDKRSMWELLLVVVVALLTISLCFYNFQLKLQIQSSTDNDAILLRQAAERSITASNTINPLIALLEISKSVQIVEGINQRYGAVITNDLFMIDTLHLLRILQDQKSKIIQDFTKSNPGSLPVHPLTAQAGYSETVYEDLGIIDSGPLESSEQIM